MLQTPEADEVIAAALAEDLGVSALRILDPRLASPDLLDADVTSTATVVVEDVSGRVVMRSAGVVCGLPVGARLFELLGTQKIFGRGDHASNHFAQVFRHLLLPSGWRGDCAWPWL
jgi:nicotinate-nucleotide pyrophosphorylase